MMENKLKEVREYLSTIEKLNEAINVLYWDMRTYMPKEGVDSRSDVIEHLSGEVFSLTTGEKVKGFIDCFEGRIEELNDIDRAMIKKLTKDYNETMKIPKERYQAFVALCSKSETAWEEAKEKDDFNIFKPYLKQVIDFQKEFIGYWGYKGNKYNTLLDKYEPGITVENLDEIFGDLKVALIELLHRIKNSETTIDNKFLSGQFDIEAQRKLSHEVIETMGFDLNRGRLDESMHPFTIEFSPKDIRLTTSYYENELTYALYSSIHEAGHGIYEQNIDENLKGTGLRAGVSMGIHESQSRFYENLLGRSDEFLTYLLPVVKKYFKQLDDINIDKFYKAINSVNPSLIRTEADELTYSLHVIIRYEIEKAIFNDEVTVDELPTIWKKKYKEYLGVIPQSDSEGILQDMHWSDGSFGYFPSYALGNIYGAQILHKILEDNNNILESLKTGDFKEINNLLKEYIHTHGSVYEPKELLKKITGEEINIKYFVDYLKKKYLNIYK